MKNALVIGSHGTIGQALAAQLSDRYKVCEINRENCDYSEQGLRQHRESLAERGSFARIICCIGVLHGAGSQADGGSGDDPHYTGDLMPEKRLADLDALKLLEYYRVNAVLPALCLKHYASLLDTREPSVFVVLSAMVGSIGENQLGGWYGYRSSKAALNMLVRNAAIELKRSHPSACLIAMHPGTTQGPLSKPFSRSIDERRYYTPKQSAQRILSVADAQTADTSGNFFNWDGRNIAW